jgi:hypothetical protein
MRGYAVDTFDEHTDPCETIELISRVVGNHADNLIRRLYGLPELPLEEDGFTGPMRIVPAKKRRRPTAGNRAAKTVPGSRRPRARKTNA